MKKLFVVVLVLALNVPIFAALSDSGALKKAIGMFGDTTRIGTVRNRTASNWTKQIGIETIGCDHDFAVLGQGFNTWDAAFADYDAKVTAGMPPIKNHFQGTASYTPTVNPTGFLNASTITVKVLLDGIPYGPDLAINNGIVDPLNFDVTPLTKGAHAFCFQIHDSVGHTSLSPAWMFFRD
jgi:hypothetical protein